MPIITDCYEPVKNRIFIRRVNRGSFCPLHTQKIIDVLTTLAYPFKISHLKSKKYLPCDFKISRIWRLNIKINPDPKSKNETSIRKYRAHKKK